MTGWVRRRIRPAAQDGVVVVIAALLMVSLLGAVAFTIDLSRLRHERGVLQNAVDLGALAGAGFMPVQGSSQANAAASTARTVAAGNSQAIQGGLGLNVDFRCVVADPDNDGGADSPDVGYSCGPSVGGSWASGWTTKRSRAFHACDPHAGDLCNTIVLNTTETMNFFFAPAMGIGQGSTGVVQAASCKGACGAAAAPLDVMMVLDRSRSMTDLDLANAKTAMLAVLDFYDPDVQMVGFSALPYYRTSDPTKCTVNPSQNYPRRGRDVWNIVPLSSNWKTPTGALDPTSSLVSSINCAQRTPAGVTVTPSGAGHTDLGDPMEAAVLELQQASRPEVPDTIIFFSDGEANQPRFNQPCSYANNWATNGKSNGIDIFTIAYGVAGARCNYDSVAPFANQFASRLFAAMATDSIDNLPGACAVTENTDNDHYFCETAASQLETVFRQVAVASVSRTRLIDL